METFPRARVRKILGIRRSTFLFSFYLSFYAFYLITGGFMFAALEAPIERAIRKELAEKRTQFLQNYSCVSEEVLEDLIQTILRASDKGLTLSKNVTEELNWSFGPAFFFVGTIVTTIGYGHVTPLSTEGKIICILYALLGIPLTLILLTAMVERLMIPSSLLLRYLSKRVGHLFQPFYIRLFHFIIILLIAIIFFIVLPAIIFTYMEPDWNYLDSLYYCFISLTTIGLGDYVPGDAQNQTYRALYKILITGYLFVGLIFMMFTLTLFYEIPELNFGMLLMMHGDEKTKDPEKIHLMRRSRSGSTFTTSCNHQEIIRETVSDPNNILPNGIRV